MEKLNTGKDKKSLKQIFNKIDISIHKWENYFKIYEHYLDKYREKKPKFLEIGVQYGGSLKMWDEFFVNRDWPIASALAMSGILILVIPIIVFQLVFAKFNFKDE